MFSLFWFLNLGDIGEQHDHAAGAREVEPRGVPSPGLLAGAHAARSTA